MTDFADEMRAALARMAADMDYASGVDAPLPPEHEGPSINIKRIGYTLPASFETLIWEGVMTEGEAREKGWQPIVRPPIPWHRRLWYRVSGWWYTHKPHAHLGPCPPCDCP